MDGGHTEQPPLKALPPPDLIAHAEFKRHTALLKIMGYLQFTSVPGPPGTTYEWAWPRHITRPKGCLLCCQSHTACHISQPALGIVVEDLWDLSEGLAGRAPKVQLVLGACERCTFLDAECNMEATTLLFRKRWSQSHWELHRHLILSDGSHSSLWSVPIDVNQPSPSMRGHEGWIAVPEDISAALWDVLEVSERLSRVDNLRHRLEEEEKEEEEKCWIDSETRALNSSPERGS